MEPPPSGLFCFHSIFQTNGNVVDVLGQSVSNDLGERRPRTPRRQGPFATNKIKRWKADQLTMSPLSTTRKCRLVANQSTTNATNFVASMQTVAQVFFPSVSFLFLVVLVLLVQLFRRLDITRCIHASAV